MATKNAQVMHDISTLRFFSWSSSVLFAALDLPPPPLRGGLLGPAESPLLLRRAVCAASPDAAREPAPSAGGDRGRAGKPILASGADLQEHDTLSEPARSSAAMRQACSRVTGR